MSKLKYLVLHCTDTMPGREVSSEELRHWHTDPKPRGNGWKQVGYRGMFHINGEQKELVPNNNDGIVDPWEVTNGAAGYNSQCEHWVYVGGHGGDTRTLKQKQAMAVAVKAFHERNPQVLIVGHNYLNPGKSCPSFDVQAWLRSIGIHQSL